MNVKTRTLLWEELRVGGAIAAACTAAGFVGQLSLRFTGTRVNPWHAVSDFVLAVTLGVPLIMGLLFTLSTANSGHLAGGFSRRILRLPVDTWSTVLVILLTRLIEVLVVSACLTAACWGVFGHGPTGSFRVVFLLAEGYLCIQVLDWLRAVAAPIAMVVGVGVVSAAVAFGRHLNVWFDAVASQNMTFGFLACFALLVVVAYAVSVVLVHWTRHGERLTLFAGLSLDRFGSLATRERRKPFSSPLRAQVWFELRQAGMSMPVMVLLFWLLANVVRWLVKYFSAGNRQSLSLSDMLDPQWMFEILPFLALLLASFAWSLKVNRSGKPRAGRPATFATRQPITAAQMAQARLAAAGIQLGVILVVLAAAYILSLLFSNGVQIAGMIAQALAHGETNYHEVAKFLVGPPLVVGLVAWIILNPPIRGRKRVGGIAFGVLLLCGFLTWLFGSDEYAAWFVVLIPTVLLCRGLDVTRRRGLMSPRSWIVCILVWATLTLLWYPFSRAATPGYVLDLVSRTSVASEILFLVFVSIALAALPVLSYVSATQTFSRREPDEGVAAQNPEQHGRSARGRLTRLQTAGIVALVAAGVALAWIRWPEEVPWVKTWRSQGLPTTLEELNTWYAPVESQQNLATLYLAAKAKTTTLEKKWTQDVLDPNTTTGGDSTKGAHVRCLSEPLTRPIDNVLVLGSTSVTGANPIPAEAWYWTQQYWNAVGKEVCADVHAASRSGLTASRYPIDLRRGDAVELPHLAELRQLARELYIETFVACVERRPDAATNAILDIFPIGNSLKDEPLIISQLVRFALLDMGCGALETAMSRLAFSADDLERIQEALACVLPPMDREICMDRAIIGEQAQILDEMERYGWLASPEVEALRGTLLHSQWYNFSDLAVAPVLNLLGSDGLAQMIGVRWFAIVRQAAHDTARRGYVPDNERLDDFWKSGLYARAWKIAVMLPAMSRSYEAEWRCRIRLDLARTAVAVERFRLAQGRLPNRLGELVPAYLEQIPRDLYNRGLPLSYRIKDNGEFVVYSFGRNRKDDGGEADLVPGKARRDGDVTFTVAPPEFRNRPQVAPELAPAGAK